MADALATSAANTWSPGRSDRSFTWNISNNGNGAKQSSRFGYARIRFISGSTIGFSDARAG